MKKYLILFFIVFLFSSMGFAQDKELRKQAIQEELRSIKGDLCVVNLDIETYPTPTAEDVWSERVKFLDEQMGGEYSADELSYIWNELQFVKSNTHLKATGHWKWLQSRKAYLLDLYDKFQAKLDQLNKEAK